MPASVELISSFMIQLRLLAAERLAAGIVATSVTIADLGVRLGRRDGLGGSHNGSDQEGGGGGDKGGELHCALRSRTM